MSTPQQPPGKLVRLRQSCDNCYNKKIKCSRGRPCDQCLTHGKECNYSPSARSGKPPKTATRSPRTFPSPGPDASMFTVGSVLENMISHVTGQAQHFLGPDEQMSFWDQQHAIIGGKYQTQHVPMLNMDQYLPQDHSRSNSCDSNIPTGGGSLNPWQQTQDLRQMHDLDQTPLSTPTHVSSESLFSHIEDHTVATKIADQTNFLLSQRHLPTPPPSNGISPGPLFHARADQTMEGQHSPLASSTASRSRCACFRRCSDFNNSLHDIYSRIKDLPRVLDRSVFNNVIELTYQAMTGCLSLLSCQHCTSPIERESAISLSNVITQISRLYQEVAFRTTLPTEVISQPIERLLLVSNSFAQQCQYLAEDPQCGLDLVGMVSRSLEWIEQSQLFGNSSISLEHIIFKDMQGSAAVEMFQH